jgi:hypothetical protein
MSTQIGIVIGKADSYIRQIVIPDTNAGLDGVALSGDEQLLKISRSVYYNHTNIADLALTLGLRT